MKRLLSILIAIALMATMSVTAFAAETDELWVGGVQVTDANKDNIVKAINDAANATVASGTATYDPDTNTLTLNGFSYTGAGYKYDNYSSAAIYTKNDLIVNLVGSNTLNCTDEGICAVGYSLTIQGNDKDTDALTVTSFSNNILAGDMTISNATITAQDMTATGNLSITGSIVNTDDSIWAWENLNISSSTINLNVEYSGLSGDEKLTITESTITTAEGKSSFIESSGAIEIVDSEVTVAEEGISANDSLTIRNSTVTATGTNFGIAVIGGDMSVSDSSTVTATGGELALCTMDDEGNPVPLMPNLTGDFAVSAGDDATSATDAAASDAATYENSYVRIEPAELEPETQTTTVTYQVDPTFTVTIPATVALGQTATIKAENVVVAKGKQVEVALTNANGFTVATPQGAELGYTVKNDETTVNEGDTVLTVNPDNGKTGETTLTFTTPETVMFAGDYTGTVTFTIAVNPAVNN